MVGNKFRPQIAVAQKDGKQLVLLTTPTHTPAVYPHIDALLETIEQRFGPHTYDLAIMEGLQYDADDARYVLGKIQAKAALDPFFDALSPGSFDLYRAAHANEDLDKVAARYMDGWLYVAIQEGWSRDVTCGHFERVFSHVYPRGDVTPAVPHMESIPGERAISGIHEIIALVNAKSVENIAAKLQEVKGRVFAYCGSEHGEAVVTAMKTV